MNINDRQFIDARLREIIDATKLIEKAKGSWRSPTLYNARYIAAKAEAIRERMFRPTP